MTFPVADRARKCGCYATKTQPRRLCHIPHTFQILVKECGTGVPPVYFHCSRKMFRLFSRKSLGQRIGHCFRSRIRPFVELQRGRACPTASPVAIMHVQIAINQVWRLVRRFQVELKVSPILPSGFTMVYSHLMVVKAREPSSVGSSPSLPVVLMLATMLLVSVIRK